MELSMSMKQTTTLSPQMMQSMEILQMGSQELLDHIQELTQENPVLEMTEQYNEKDEFSILRKKLQWLESTDVQNRTYHRDDGEETPDALQTASTADFWEENLYYYVLSQLQPMHLESRLEAAAKFIVESLNQSGYLDDALDELAADFGCEPALMEQALAVVQSLEPAGVAARSLSECLALQLERRGEDDALTLAIAERYLDALAKSRYGLIARELGADPCQVRRACDLIRTLNPKPGTGFATRENLIYIIPDIIVVNFADHFELLANDYYFPSLNISGYYRALMRETPEDDVKEYLVNKVRQAKWVLRSIEQRRTTLMDCARCILDIQERFFRYGPGFLVPMTLADVAARLEIHESTVSRAMKDKYIQCASGIYPFGYFFSRGLGGAASAGAEGAVSPDSAKALLKKLVAGEDKRKPLSDQKLCELMEREGVLLSRRTVAKYRDELGIPSTTGRRQYEE